MNALEGLGIESVRAAEAERQAKADEVGQDSFLEMLVAQLENQDPLNPQDSAAFAAQLAQFSSVEQLVAVRAGVDALVAAAGNSASASGSGNAPGIDATNLVGKEVVVFGNQIEVDALRSPVVMPIRTVDTALKVDVRIYDEAGTLRYQSSILRTEDDGSPIALRAGDHEFEFDPGEHNLPEGVYAIEFEAVGIDGEAVPVLPMITGIVSGAILSSEPRIRVGNRIFDVSEVLEVRLPENWSGTAPAGNPAAPLYQTGGGQYVRPNPTPPTPHYSAGS